MNQAEQRVWKVLVLMCIQIWYSGTRWGICTIMSIGFTINLEMEGTPLYTRIFQSHTQIRGTMTPTSQQRSTKTTGTEAKDYQYRQELYPHQCLRTYTIMGS